MKYLYQAVTNLLRADSTLVNLVGYTSTDKNIMRGYQTQGKWNKLILYYLQTASNFTDFSNRIREIPLIIRVYDRDNDLNVEDMAERIIKLMASADLSTTSQVHVYRIRYTGDLIPTSRNPEVKAFERVLRFSILARQDNW